MAEIKGKIDPLRFDAKIVTDTGLPTPYFIRQWNGQQRINSSTEGFAAAITANELAIAALTVLVVALDLQVTALGVTVTALSATVTTLSDDLDTAEAAIVVNAGDIDDLETAVTAAEGDIDDLETTMTVVEGDIDDLEARNINTTAPLAGGGNLSADRTLTLNASGVTPGTYGDATNSAQITIDSFGRITAALDVAISGGGGGGGTIATEDEGSSIDTVATTLNFVGAGVTATDAGSNVTTVTIPAAAAAANTIITQDEGSGVDTTATTLNFVGAGVVATDAGSGVTTVTIAGGGGGGGSKLTTAITDDGGSVDSASAAFKGTIIIPTVNMDIHAIYIMGRSDNGDDYQGAVLELNGSNVVQAVTGTSVVYTAAFTKLGVACVPTEFSSGVSLVAGTRYMLGVSNQTNSDTSSFSVIKGPSSTESNTFQGQFQTIDGAYIAKKVPGIGDSASTISSNRVCMQIVYELT